MCTALAYVIHFKLIKNSLIKDQKSINKGIRTIKLITEKDIKIESLIKDFNRKKDKTNALNL